MFCPTAQVVFIYSDKVNKTYYSTLILVSKNLFRKQQITRCFFKLYPPLRITSFFRTKKTESPKFMESNFFRAEKSPKFMDSVFSRAEKKSPRNVWTQFFLEPKKNSPKLSDSKLFKLKKRVPKVSGLKSFSEYHTFMASNFFQKLQYSQARVEKA